MNAWDDPDWFRDEREANPPEGYEVANREWLRMVIARLARDVLVPNPDPSRFDLADGRVPDHDPDATVESVR